MHSLRLIFTHLSWVIVLFCFSFAPLCAQFEGEIINLNSQPGIWFGPVTPVPGTEVARVMKADLGGGAFYRINLFPKNLRNHLTWETATSYNIYRSIGPEELHLVPIYFAIDYRLPINLSLNFITKLGGGITYAYQLPEQNKNWLPTIYFGNEISFPASKWVNIGLRVDYYAVLESYLSPPKGSVDYEINNGHILNFGLSINLNLEH